MKVKFIICILLVALIISCEIGTPKETEYIEKELNILFKDSPSNLLFEEKVDGDTLFLKVIDSEITKENIDMNMIVFHYNFIMFKYYSEISEFKHLKFSLVDKEGLKVVETLYRSNDFNKSLDLFKNNTKLIDYSNHTITNMSHYISNGIQLSLNELKNSFDDFKFNGDFYELLIDYSLDCEKKFLNSNPKKYMFLIAYTLNEAKMEKELHPMKFILDGCKIDTNMLDRKININ
jgi:hypothetical protein